MGGMFVDSHAHLTGETVVDHVEEMLQRAQQHGLCAIVNICTDSESLKRGLALTQRHRWIFNAAAATPHDVEKIGDSFFPEVAQFAREGGLIAIGETGLDYHYEHAPRELQRHHLRNYLKLAVETKLPLIFHCREAFDDLFQEVDALGKEMSAVLHCFTGTLEEAQQCLKRGWMISLSGIITFKNSIGLREIVTEIPLENLLIETDTPYLAPQSKRGKMNEPGYVVEVAEMIAQIKGVSATEVGNVTTRSAAQFFAFPKQIVSV